MVVTKGAFKGYHGLVKGQYEDGIDVELDAKLASFGQTRKRFLIEDVVLECRVECVMRYVFFYTETNPSFSQAYLNASAASDVVKSLEHPPSRSLDSSSHSGTRRTRREHTLEYCSKTE